MKRIRDFFLVTALASAAFGADIILCNTGFGGASTSGCGAAITSPSSNNLTADGNWYTATNSSGTFLGQSYVTVNGTYPLTGSGPWLSNNATDSSGNGAGSSWLMPGGVTSANGLASNNQGAVYNNGNYYFSQQFNVSDTTVNTASVSGYWLADDYGAGIFLNGVQVGQSNLPAFGGLGGPMVPFNISQGTLPGQAIFTGGSNVLTFGVINDSSTQGNGTCIALSNCQATPTGVRVLFTSATETGVPEPSSVMLTLSGLIVLGFMARRRLAKV